MTTPTAVTRSPARRAGVVRRALRVEATRIREPRRLAAIAILVVVFALALAAMFARGDVAGADAQAYWAAVRIWLEGGDPYHPQGPFLPYVYAPWMLPIFIPWALLPWEVAWFAWRGVTILLLLWSIRWAYARRPLPTAILVGLLSFPMAANLDTGNINLLLALALFGAHFTGPRVGGLIWGLATWMKWVPAPLWLVLPPKARAWGLVFLALSGLLSLMMLPITIVQLQVLFGFGERPIRADFLVFIWSAVPWWWRLRHPFAFLSPSAWATALRKERDRAMRWGRAFRLEPAATLSHARHLAWAWVRRFLGLDDPLPAGRRAGSSAAAHVVAEIGD
ncbi:MAG TPA: glycosyltransferase 87 family protein [Candidatus Limnocylindrales bacterium]|nr:glycosyltransferase 87 family protein [Candidatus Limnocylindrales bacterium]